MTQSVTKNTAVMTIASVGQKIISFVYFTLIARYLGVEGTGKYFFAISFTIVFSVLADLGLTNVLVREAAKTKDRLQTFLSTVLALKLGLSAVSILFLVIALWLLQYSAETRLLVYVAAITMVLDTIHLTLYGVLRALGELRYEAIGIMGSQFVTLIIGGVCIWLRFPLIAFLWTFTIVSFLNVFFVVIIVRRRYGLFPLPVYDTVMARSLVIITAPFALAAIFARVYGYIDSILLSKLAGDAALGWYSIPYKISTAFQFIPVALVAALYPRFSEYFVTHKDRLADIFLRALQYMLIVAAPITVGIVVLARDIIVVLYTEAYINSVRPLQFLMVGLIFTFLSFPIGALLNACNRQRTQTTIVGMAMVVNIVLNLVFIPRFGVLGAALASLISASALCLGGYMIVPQIIRIRHWLLLKTVLQLTVAAGGMGVVVWLGAESLPLVVRILIGGIVYGVLLLATGAINRQQLRDALLLIRQ